MENLSQFTTVQDIVNTVFVQPPREPCAYSLMVTDSPFNDARVAMFPFLMEILTTGAKKLFGDDITPQTMSSHQFDKLKTYMLSLGYQVKHNFSYQNDATLINIWFEPFVCNRNCHGNVVL
ncbi:MAG: hypothetical protein EBU90_04355 [Proteobacteria bacterium]|nr:hypothetical protein [Pseudomonadota bacterium]NBP15217.1 hypothetical protein [bacterium]